MRSRLLLCALLPLVACQLQRPLERPAWSHARAGTWGAIGRLALWNDHSATSDITFDSNFGPQRVQLETELEGRFGGALGVEAYVARDLSLLLGFDHRRFDPGATPGFLYQTVTSDELFLAARWLVPWRLGSEDRGRPYLELKLGYLPSTRFEAQVDLSSIGQPNPRYRFDGSGSWNLGLSAGLLHQLRSDLVLQVGALHEWPLDASTDAVELEFLPGVPVVLDTAIEPEGTIVLIGLTWYP